MELDQIAIGGGTVGLLVAIIAWVRFLNKDKADVSKSQAEANTIIVDNFKNLITTYQNENKMLTATVDELKRQVLRLTEQINKIQGGR